MSELKSKFSWADEADLLDDIDARRVLSSSDSSVSPTITINVQDDIEEYTKAKDAEDKDKLVKCSLAECTTLIKKVDVFCCYAHRVLNICDKRKCKVETCSSLRFVMKAKKDCIVKSYCKYHLLEANNNKKSAATKKPFYKHESC
jgi:hypothetical protein